NYSGLAARMYNDGGTPDPITGDGVTPPGSAGAAIGSSGSGAGEATGIRFEMSVAWATLGVPAGTPLFIHPSLSSNTNLPSGVLDNANVIDTRLVAVGLTGGTTKGTAPGRSVDFPHVVTNNGTTTDTINVFTRPTLGFPTSIY